jgi:hypothetical protein
VEGRGSHSEVPLTWFVALREVDENGEHIIFGGKEGYNTKEEAKFKLDELISNGYGENDIVIIRVSSSVEH